GIRDFHVTGVQTCALPIWAASRSSRSSLSRRGSALRIVGMSTASAPSGQGATVASLSSLSSSASSSSDSGLSAGGFSSSLMGLQVFHPGASDRPERNDVDVTATVVQAPAAADPGTRVEHPLLGLGPAQPV